MTTPPHRRRLSLGALLAVLAVLAFPAVAQADCARDIIGEAYQNESISHTYSLECYRSAMSQMTNEMFYTNVPDIIRAAMLREAHREKTSTTPPAITETSNGASSTETTASDGNRVLAAAPHDTASEVPLPVILLGIAAGVLVLGGLVSLVLRRRLGSGGGGPDTPA